MSIIRDTTIDQILGVSLLRRLAADQLYPIAPYRDNLGAGFTFALLPQPRLRI